VLRDLGNRRVKTTDEVAPLFGIPAMLKQSDGDLHWLHVSPWLASSLAAGLLLAIGALDYVTGSNISFTLFYLAPIALATWFLNPRAGYAFAVAAAAIGLAVDLTDRPQLLPTIWEAGVKCGLYCIVTALLSYVRTHHIGRDLFSGAHRVAVALIGVVAVLAVAGGLIHRQVPPALSKENEAFRELVVEQPHGAMRELADLIGKTMQASRPVLLGSRDPNGPSCVDIIRRGDIQGTAPTNRGDLNGGPGTTLATIYYFDRQEFKTAMQDYAWHQGRLKTFLENTTASNRPAAGLAHQLAEKAQLFAQVAESWTTWPADVATVGFKREDDWPSFCMAALDRAVAAKDLEATKRWAGELAAVTFALDDLHCWLGFLADNHLTALEFQRQCEGVFVAANSAAAAYDPRSTISWFPAGVLSLNGVGNYLEVERQAERMFSMPSDRLYHLSNDKYRTAASVWIPPTLRECYLKLQQSLSAENQKVWEAAARTPYEHSYLVNMLYRATNADTTDFLTSVLTKFDQVNPHATVGELMSVLMYRGHSFAGLEWADRFQPELLQASNDISTSETNLQALMDACRWTNSFYQPENYGVTFTLRDALEQKRLDCVRATDMIGSIFRNAGRPRFGNVRWSASTGGHSVAAYFGPGDKKLKTRIVDGLMPPDQPESWPDCYFHGHAWPPGLENNAPPYAAELYARGIDSYIWLEGYIIRGPTAGTLMSAGIPYSTTMREASTRKVYDGPYPQ
jgi:hypothetical protein